MREIRFRIWNGESIEENVIDFAIDNETKHKEFYIYPDDIFMQYTGLKDKNGVEIYEGDIVKTQIWTEISEDVSSGEWYVGEIIFRNGSFCGHFPKPEVIEYLQFFRYEVIGNIYENPELLEDNNVTK